LKTAPLLLVLFAAVLATSIRAETINCMPIISLPITISRQGIYCLTGNLSTSQTSGAAITINAPNVTLDFNGWKLGGQGAGSGTQAYGIYSIVNNVTVKNGIVRGFLYGIYLSGSGAVVEDMLVDSNTEYGIYSYGEGALVERNQVVDTGGSTTSSNVPAFGIYMFGGDSTVSDNMVSGVIATGAASETGIAVNLNSTVRNNVVSNTTLPSSGVYSYAISAYKSIALNNTVSNFDYGIYNISGGIYAHNTANNCTTNYFGGTAGGGNSP
jgi:hypothetical protein